jgi:hypothetical protein
MALSERVRNRWSDGRIIHQAERIADPVEKLHFLRHAMKGREQAPRRPVWKRLMLAASVIAGFFFLLPPPSVISDAVTVEHYASLPAQGLSRMTQKSSDVWLVEDGRVHETYSNGLRIDNSFLVENEPRFYQVLDRRHDLQPSIDWRSLPVGIVFHSTESSIGPFSADQNENLKRVAQSLLKSLRENRSYNFVIDRFGRVFRVVSEDQVANHAGNSVWADDDQVFLNLNSSFIGVAFEAQSGSGATVTINPAQIYAARVLTEMLRSKFKIRAENCVTHAQVSVNPSNLRVGYHTDWATGFPFAAIGLRNNYDLPVPSLSDFGFEYDSLFRKAMGNELWRGIGLAEQQFVREAVHDGRSLGEHRRILQDRYRRLYSALKLTGALEEHFDATNSTQ